MRLYLSQSLRLTGIPVNLIVFMGGTFFLFQTYRRKWGVQFCMDRLRISDSCLRWAGVFLLAIFSLILAAGCLPARAQSYWNAIGPAGGDARSFAAAPGERGRLYLGTTNSWIYESADRGTSWRRLAKIEVSDDLILDHIAVDQQDARTLYVAAWKLERPDGGLWVSHDAGKSWKSVEGLRGQSIRAFAQAPSNPRELFAGTLEGVFRSKDGGETWKLISPAGSKEIHEVESLAVDPTDAEIVYAGTWHLPWKTTDGGTSWHSIKQGVIDDSDVFSIIVDPVRPGIVFASACSGIYKSENGAELFQKIQGIPSTARRTRVLKQDPANREVVYAGTTEGLYKTVDGGKSFKRMTGPDVIVNDVFVDPGDASHVLLATDRGGVLESVDGAASFRSANEGFSGRKVEALLVDRADSNRIYAGVVNDKSYGGVFASGDGGVKWEQLAAGLEGRDVFSLAQAPDGTVVAGTSHGIFALEAGTGEEAGGNWSARNTILNTVIQPFTLLVRGKKVNVEKPVKQAARQFDGRAYALDLSGDAWLAATTGGLLTSKDKGASWQGGPVMGATNFRAVAARGAILAAARKDQLVLSRDAGSTWSVAGLPVTVTGIERLAFSADGTLWMGAREGVYFTHDLGKTWMWFERLPFRDVTELSYDAGMKRVLVASQGSDFVYGIDPLSWKWDWWKTGYRIFEVRSAGGRLLAASLYDGVLVEPSVSGVVAGDR